MKKIFLYSVLSCSFLVMSCQKRDINNTISLRISAISFCADELNHMQSTLEVWQTRVLEVVEENHITLESHEFGFKEIYSEGPIHCGNCNPTGDYIDIKIDNSDIEKAINLGFRKL